MGILDQFLKKNGVNSYLELTEEERETYRNWSNMLVGRQLTQVDVANFLDKELDDSVGKLMNMQITQREDIFLKMKVDFIRKVKLFLKTPETEKNLIEAQIKSQL